MEVILSSIKKLLGIDADYTIFDNDIIIYINSVFATLKQIGVGPVNGFFLKDGNETWDQFIASEENLGDIQTYVYMKVKLIFDPPATSFAIDSTNKMINEIEWRIQVDRDITQTTV